MVDDLVNAFSEFRHIDQNPVGISSDLNYLIVEQTFDLRYDIVRHIVTILVVGWRDKELSSHLSAGHLDHSSGC